jgi:uncharacterized damage-inducible protein DinB
MPDRHRTLLTRLDARRRALLSEVAAMTADQLVFRPAPDSWSALDVVEHLVRVEEAILSRIREREPRTLREALWAKGALALMRVYFAVGRRFKVPTQVIVPLGGVTLSDLAARWDAAHAALRARVNLLDPEELARPLMRHPQLGLLTPRETLIFLLRHMAHHRRQIHRIRRARGYPRS